MSTTTVTSTRYNLRGRGNGSIQTAPATTDTQTTGSTVAEQLAAVNNGESPDSSLSDPPSVSRASSPGVRAPDLVIGNDGDGHGVPSGTDSEQDSETGTEATLVRDDRGMGNEVDGPPHRQNRVANANGFDDDERENRLWTTVPPRRRSVSRDNVNNNYSHSSNCVHNQNHYVLTEDQLLAVRQAELSMSESERARVQSRMGMVDAADGSEDNGSDPSSSDSEPDPEPSTSKGKGKTVDPRNWGAARLPEHELNVERQKAGLAHYTKAKKTKEPEGLSSSSDSEAEQSAKKPKSERRVARDKVCHKRSKECSRERARYVAQGHAASEALSDLVGNHIHDLVQDRPRRKLGDSARVHYEADHVPCPTDERRAIRVLQPPHLPLRAHLIRTQISLVVKVIRNHRVLSRHPTQTAFWAMETVIIEETADRGGTDTAESIYCSNQFCQKHMTVPLMSKLKRAFQNDKPVRDYLVELNDLFNTVGLIDEREKVHKLWSGLNKKIQKGLWHEKLNPEISSYEEVSRTAELIEIIENVDMGPDPGSNNKKKDKGTGRSSSNNNGGSGLSHYKALNDKGNSSRNSGNNGTSSSNRGNSSSDKGGKSDYRKAKTHQNHQRKGNQHRELTDKEKDEYRAAGKCF
ncbi:hypothetical protein L218DRAFT_1082114 [Marasmius fiardii PR-910]|nr:hypothetical protein L218DRAFT_1082114 [Marasmius fiardii PR-910]